MYIMAVSLATDTFKQMIEDAVTMVNAMSEPEQVQAIQYWNGVSELLQEIVNRTAGCVQEMVIDDTPVSHPVTDINGILNYQLDHEKIPDFIDTSQLTGMGMINRLRFTVMDNDETLISLVPTSSKENQTPDTETLGKQVGNDLIESNILLSHHQDVSLVNDLITEQTDIPPQPCNEDSLPLGLDSSCDELADADNTIHLMIAADRPMAAQDTPSLTNHKLSKRETDTLYECSKCERSFDTRSQLTTHIQTHTKPHICSHCSMQFSTKGNLTVHERSHSGERPYTCPTCSIPFSTRGNLKRHIRSHAGIKPWTCSQCEARFTEKKSLKVHMRKHTGVRPYQCQLCPKAFSQSGILKGHMAVHLDQRAFKCSLCGRSFRQKSQLGIHEQRHVGLRKYECEQCTATFLTKGDMKRHQRTHSGERPYGCELCGKTFTRKQSLVEHTNRHNNQKPYQCKYCHLRFVELSACCKHQKTHSLKLDFDKSSHVDPNTITTIFIQQMSTDSVEDAVITANQELDSNSRTMCDVQINGNDDMDNFTAMDLLANASTYQQQQ